MLHSIIKWFIIYSLFRTWQLRLRLRLSGQVCSKSIAHSDKDMCLNLGNEEEIQLCTSDQRGRLA